TGLLSNLVKGRSDFAFRRARIWLPSTQYSRSFSVASRCRGLVHRVRIKKDARTTPQYFKRPMPRIEPGNASAPTEPVTALHLRNSDRSPKRETIRARPTDVKAREHKDYATHDTEGQG